MNLPRNQRFMGQILPEITLLEDEDERVLVMRALTRQMMRSVKLWLAVIGYSVLIGILGGSILPIIRSLGVPPQAHPPIGGAVIGFVAVSCLAWILKPEAQRRLRAMLRERGVAVCMACGYDLRGTPEPRCPECGQPAAPIEGTDREAS